MRKFLLNFMDAAEVDKIEEEYKSKYSDAQGLPTYIPKARLDEEIAKRKSAEEAVNQVPKDWKEQLDNLKVELETQKNDYEAKLTASKTEAERTAKIYGSGARNVKAVAALLDNNADIDKQLEALKKSDPYLFNTSDAGGKGTGKHGGGNDPAPENKMTQEAMYKAVGMIPPTHN